MTDNLTPETVRPRKRRLSRPFITTVLLVLPPVLMWIQLSHPFILRPGGDDAPRAITSTLPATIPTERELARAAKRGALDVSAISCLAVSFPLGLVARTKCFPLAFLLGLYLTVGFIHYDGMGAFMGPIMLPLAFWPLIRIGRALKPDSWIIADNR